MGESADFEYGSLVSVIVRTKDRPVLLREALESLAAQSYPNIEAVVVNDGGNDVSAVTAEFDRRLEITLEQLDPGLGRCAAANRGIELARGPWLAFLDDDDLWLPDGISTLVKAADGRQGFFYGRVEAKLIEHSEQTTPVATFHTFGRAFDIDALLFENFIPIIGCLMPLCTVRENGGFDANLECFEDWDLFLRLTTDLFFHYTDADVAEYRVFGESFITGAGGEQQQHKGRTSVYTKHWHRLSPKTLSRMQNYAKAELLPNAIDREAASWRVRVHDLEQGAADCKRGLTDLKSQLLDRDKRLDALWQERLEIDQDRNTAWQKHTVLTTAHEQLENQHLDLQTAHKDLETEHASVAALLEAEPTREALISVVIVNYEGRHHLEKCLPALAATGVANIEVIVVDNGSKDSSVTWVQQHHPEVRILEMGENLGFGEANRRGALAAKGGYLAFLNSDTVVEANWLYELLRVLILDPNIAAACSTLRLLQHPEVLNGRGGGMSKLGYGFDQRYGMPFHEDEPVDRVKDVFFPTAAAMLMRHRDFFSCGGFDPAMFMYHEDVDLGWRLWLQGRRVVVCRDSIVHHHFGGTTHASKGMAWRERLGSRHNVRSILKHYEVVNILKAFKGLLKLWGGMGAWRHIAHVAWWNLLHLPGTLTRRRRIQRLRHISDAELNKRGFISPSPYPAPSPEIPRNRADRDAENWVRSPVIRIGLNSALGRLGPGWYPPHPIGEHMVRPFCGDASCTIKVEPGSCGAVELDLHVPPGMAPAGEVTLWANQATTTTSLTGELWQVLKMDGVYADDNGLVEIRLRSPSWRPHLVSNNWDFRLLGGAVKEVRLLTDQAPASVKIDGVSVIITTFNRWPILEKTLDALRDQTWPNLQVVVMDDGSSDDTFDRLVGYRETHSESFDLTAATQENQGQGMARNNALELAEKSLILFLGDDIIPEPTLVERHVERHREVGEPSAVVGFTDWYRQEMDVSPFMEMVNLLGHQFGYGFMVSGADQPFTCFYTSNISIEKDVLGPSPFDATFSSYGWEDVELGYRASLKGVRIIYDEEARAGHLHPTTIESFFKRQLQVGRTFHDLISIHPELAVNPYMPAPTPPKWYRFVSPFAAHIASFIARLDRRHIKVSTKILHHVLMIGFYRGKAEPRAEK